MSGGLTYPAYPFLTLYWTVPRPKVVDRCGRLLNLKNPVISPKFLNYVGENWSKEVRL